MDDLIAFLTARLDEDEAAAKAARGVEWDWRYVAQPFGERPSIAHTVHIARHDPARVLREVEAKRALARTGASLAANHDTPIRIVGEGVLMDIASIWSDHADYRQEWAL